MRGFAGTAGNVVLNGARPSSKSETLETLLARIPASRVKKVEVGPGDLYGADYSSKTQVANLFLSADRGIAGNATVSAVRHWFGKIVPTGSASVLLSRGPSTFNLSGDLGRTDYFEEGFDRVTDFATGDLVEFRRKFNSIHPHDPYLSGSWALENADDRSLHVNARFAPSTFFLRQDNHVTPTDDDERDDNLVEDYKTRVFELGGDVTRPLAGGAVKLVGLANRQHKETRDTYLFRSVGGADVLGGSEQLTKSQRNESIGRLSWSRQKLLGFRFEAGAEAAWNTLDYNLGFFDLKPGGDRIRKDLPIENATVREVRGEFYINAGRPLAKNLRMDAALNYEISRLKVRGDALADRSLKFLKPSMTLDWQPGGGWHVQAIARRTVAQLDFFDFVSSAELSVGRVNGGNANLVPQRAWENRLLIEHPSSARARSAWSWPTTSSASCRTASSCSTTRMCRSTRRAISAPAACNMRTSPSTPRSTGCGRACGSAFTARSSARGSRTRSRTSNGTSAASFRAGSGMPTSGAMRGNSLMACHCQRLPAHHLLPHRRVRHELQYAALCSRPSPNTGRPRAAPSPST